MFLTSWSNLTIEKGTFLHYAFGDSTLAHHVIAAIIMLTIPITLISFYQKNNLHPKSVYFQHFLYLSLICPILIQFNWVDLLVIPLVISAIHQVMATYNKTNVLAETFQSGMFLGIASLVKPEILFLFPFLIISNAVFQSFNLRNIIYILSGLISIPFLIYGFDLNDHLGIIENYSKAFSSLTFQLQAFSSNLYELLPGGFFALLAVFHLFKRVSYLNIRQQLNRYVLIWLMLFSIPFFFISGSVLLGIFLIAFAISTPLNHQFKNMKKPILADLEYLLIILGSLYLINF